MPLSLLRAKEEPLYCHDLLRGHGLAFCPQGGEALFPQMAVRRSQRALVGGLLPADRIMMGPPDPEGLSRSEEPDGPGGLPLAEGHLSEPLQAGGRDPLGPEG